MIQQIELAQAVYGNIQQCENVDRKYKISLFVYINYINLKIVQIILWPAKIVPFMVPLTLDTPILLR